MRFQDGCSLLPHDVKRFLLPRSQALAAGLVETGEGPAVHACFGHTANVEVGASGGNLAREWTAAPRTTLRSEEKKEI